MNIESIYQNYISSSGIEINSKKIKKGSIFLALKGENFDGNKFALEAIENGAMLAIIDNKKYYEKYIIHKKKIVLVKDTLFFLQKLAIYHRYKCRHIPIIAIVGSNGKTTTKELIKKVLSKKYKRVHSTKKNYNNHIGVPLTILSMSYDTQISVIEIGANHEKEINNMCNIINPDYGYITNFGKAHLEGFKNFKGIIRSKLELYKFLKEKKKIAFVNGDDSIQLNNSKKINRFIFSNENNSNIIKANVKFIYIWNLKNEKSILYVKKTKIISHLIGNYNLYNIASSITIGIYFKISINDIKKSIEEYVPKNYRSQILNKNNKKIIIDCYNANPTSMLKSLTYFNNNIIGNKIVILGDMLELGKFSVEEHEKIVFFIKKSNIHFAFLIGNLFFNTKERSSNIKKFLDRKNFTKWIKKYPIKKNNYILIKGSRKMALEKIISLILK